MNSLATEAEVDADGWLKIKAPAPPGTPPGKLAVLVVWTPPTPAPGAAPHPHAGTLRGKVSLAPDFHAPLADFSPYAG